MGNNENRKYKNSTSPVRVTYSKGCNEGQMVLVRDSCGHGFYGLGVSFRA